MNRNWGHSSALVFIGSVPPHLSNLPSLRDTSSIVLFPIINNNKNGNSVLINNGNFYWPLRAKQGRNTLLALPPSIVTITLRKVLP